MRHSPFFEPSFLGGMGLDLQGTCLEERFERREERLAPSEIEA
jgi:hypothetical protein